jgi:hypothetical protein
VPFETGHLYWITFGFIQPPHEKISLCICSERPLFFWINSNPKPHGIGQLQVSVQLCPILRYDSVLDLSGAKTGAEADLNTARHAGPISGDLRALVIGELSNPIRLLPDAHRLLALGNLS